MDRYSVLIVGAGKIGAFFDKPASENTLTHAHAFTTHPGFVLKGFVDANPQQAARAAAVWGGNPFASVSDAFEHGSIDVVVVATPDETHAEVLLGLLARPIKLVFAEKPIAESLGHAVSIVQLYGERGIELAVNYSRHYTQAFADLQKVISQNEFGNFLSGVGHYGKGTLHNGSHMVDLLRFLLGEPVKTKTLGAIEDWSVLDPTCSALLSMPGGGQFMMQGVDCRNFTIFEMDFLFEKARVRTVDSGFAIEISEVVDSEMFTGYRVLSSAKRQDVDLGNALYAAATNIHDHLSNGKPLVCTAHDGVRALEICSDIIGGLA
jgi:predicted dehydrogenase